MNLRPVLVVEDDLDVLQRAPIELRRIPDPQTVCPIERPTTKLNVLDSWLLDERFVARADRRRDVALGGERLAVLNARDSEIEDPRVSVVSDDAGVRGVVLQVVLNERRAVAVRVRIVPGPRGAAG